MIGVTLGGACAAAERDGIFLIDDGSEAIHLSDHRGPGNSNASLLVEGPGGVREVDAAQQIGGETVDRFARQRSALSSIVLSASRAQRLDPALVHAVIGVESGYAPRAVSPRGALGLMQLMPSTAKAYGVTDPFDPRQNIVAGARHLRSLLDQFSQSTTLALAAYNAGAAAVWRHRQKVPPFAETVAYVPKVLGSYAALRQQVTAP